MKFREKPEIIVETTRQSADLLAEEIVAYLHKAGRLLSREAEAEIRWRI